VGRRGCSLREGRCCRSEWWIVSDWRPEAGDKQCFQIFIWAVRREACRNTCQMYRDGFPAHFRPKIGIYSTRVGILVDGSIFSP